MTIYATGCSGTIGRHFPSKITPIKERLESKLETFLKIRFQPTDIVIHAGARVGAAKVAQSIEDSFQINVVGSRNLALAALHKNVSKFVYISTCHVYKFGKDFISENDEVEPVSHYSEQKYLGEQEVLQVFQDYPERVCIIRVFSLLGWDMPRDSLGGAVDRILQGETSFQLINGDDVRDFQTPMQVARTIVKVSENSLTEGVVNLCSAVGMQVSVAAQSLMKLDNRYNSRMQDNLKSGFSKVPRIVGDNRKIKSLIPDTNLEWEFSQILG